MSDMDGYQDPVCRDCGLDACTCPTDHDAPMLCAHGRDMGDGCAACAADAERHLCGAFRRALDRIRRTDDETRGAALAARVQGETKR